MTDQEKFEKEVFEEVIDILKGRKQTDKSIKITTETLLGDCKITTTVEIAKQ
jgi:hypothetical protein